MKYKFNKIFSTSGIKKYQNPASGISYDFDKLLSDFNLQNFDVKSSEKTIPFSKNKSDVEKLENDEKYKAFTNYVLNNSNDEKVLNYLKQLENITTSNISPSRLFDDSGNLKSDWQNTYNNLRNDHKFGYYHLTPGLLSDDLNNISFQSASTDNTKNNTNLNNNINNPNSLNDQNNSNNPNISNNINTNPDINSNNSNNNLNNSNINPNNNLNNQNNINNQPLEFNPLKYNNSKPLESTWSDWIPLTSQLINSFISANNQRNLQKKYQLPLNEGTYNQYKVINNYAERSEGLNNIAKMQQEAEEKVKGTSDLKAGFDYLNKVRSSAEDLRSKLNLTKANSFNQSSLQAQDVANKNKSFAYEISNANRKINASAANNILESEAKYDLQKLKNLNSYITNMTTSYNKKQYDDNINMLNFKNNLLLTEYQSDVNKLKDKYKVIDDYKESNAWKNFRNSEFEGAVESEDSDTWYEEQWNSNSEIAKDFKTQYEQEKKEAEKQYEKELEDLYLQIKSKSNIYNPAIISNQKYFGLYKSGGSIKNTSNSFARLHQLYQQHEDNKTQKTIKNLSEDIKNRFNNISQKELILLRQVFK